VTTTSFSMPFMAANVDDIPPDPGWHDSAVLIGDLATLNTRIARHIAAVLDADTPRGKPVTTAQEAALGRQLVELGQRLLARTQAISCEPLQSGSG
jgi:hypothetical protein